MNKVTKGLYQHYKGGIYKVLCVAVQEHSLQSCVVYKGVKCNDNENGIWVRSLQDFHGRVLCNDELVPRFKRIVQSPKTKV